jgi:hypothetical protein
MHPALIQQMAAERSAAFYAAARARRDGARAGRRPLIVRAARRAFRPVHA